MRGRGEEKEKGRKSLPSLESDHHHHLWAAEKKDRCEISTTYAEISCLNSGLQAGQ